MSYLGLSLWSLGFPDQASKWTEESIRLAREQRHPFSLALALDFAASFHALRREDEVARNYAEEAIEISEKQNFPMWLAMGRILSGWAQAERGELSSGIEMMHEGLDAWQGTGATLGRPNFSGLLADVLGKAGCVEEGLEVVVKALKAVHSTDERVNEAELYRLQGKLLQRQGAEVAKIESSFRKALDVARQQGAKGAELRGAVSLGKLWMDEGKPEDTRGLLLDICTWFAEGLDTVDFQEARAILEGIS